MTVRVGQLWKWQSNEDHHDRMIVLVLRPPAFRQHDVSTTTTLLVFDSNRGGFGLIEEWGLTAEMGWEMLSDI